MVLDPLSSLGIICCLLLKVFLEAVFLQVAIMVTIVAVLLGGLGVTAATLLLIAFTLRVIGIEGDI